MDRYDRYLNQVLRMTLGRAIDWRATGAAEFSADLGGANVRLTGDPDGTWAALHERDSREPSMCSADRSDLLLVMDLLRYRVMAG